MNPDLGADAPALEVLLQEPYRAQLQVPGVDGAHGLCFGRHRDELPVLDLIAQRGEAAHPQPFALRGSDLVADALTRDLALELGEGQQDVEGETAHRGCG